MIIATTLSCILGVGLTCKSILRRDDARMSLANEDRAELRRLNADLKALRGQLASRRSEQAVEIIKAARHPQHDLSTDEVDPFPAFEGDEGEKDVSDQQASLSDAEVRVRMDTRFARESVDPAWRNGAIPMLQRQFAAHLGDGARITDIDCRQSLCRVKTVHGDIEAYNKFSRDMVRAGSNEWQGQALMNLESEPQAGREVLAVAYMAKPGEDLSAMLGREP